MNISFLSLSLGYLVWDPSREIFPWNLPLIGRPILWYGFLFALGFFFGYLLLCYLLNQSGFSKKISNQIAEQFLLYIGLGAVIGARLGDVFFYQDFHYWITHPLEILYVWEGGLASHGAAIGIVIALILLTRRLKKFTFLKAFDYIVIPAALVGGFIRIGNFINQEILGKATDVPWAVIFVHPAGGGLPVPRHPAQLYESIAYFLIFLLLLWLFKTKPFFRKEGKISGLFLVLLFGFRFFVETLKEEQSALISPDFPLTMGQLLSIPFVLWGFWLCFRSRYTNPRK